MGFNISWLAFPASSRDVTLRALGLHVAGEAKAWPETLVSGVCLPNDGYLVFLNSCFHPFATPEALASASTSCHIVGCQVAEHIMVSAAFSWRNGVRLWSVTHESDKGVWNLEVDGAPPPKLSSLRAAAGTAQKKERKFPFLPLPRWEVDYFFRIPIDLAASVVGYEHDRVQYSWGKPAYEALAEGQLT
jgi:hypothetical protein